MTAHSMLVIALSLIFGVLGARLFKSMKIPQVVGYIVIGLILGRSGLNIISEQMIQEFVPINFIALAMIGFLVGGELKKQIFKKYGKKFVIVLLFEGISAFIFVTFAVGLYSGNWALAIILGALASATAPAATVDVLWEYKAAGVLTATVFAIVALDDGLALILYGFANSISKVMLAGGAFSFRNSILSPLYEIVGSALLGIVVTYLFKFTLDRTRKYKTGNDLILSFTFGSLMLIIALSLLFKLDLILAEMFFGLTFVNIAPDYSKRVFELLKGFSPPIYILFFILVGARLKFELLSTGVIISALLYVVARTAGKMFGASLGARISHSSPKIAKYLGFCLFSQAGVSIGLAIMTAQNFPALGTAVIGIITLTTFIVQMVGPPFVRYAVLKAGEDNKNITETEMLQKYSVEEVMDKNPITVKPYDSLSHLLSVISDSPYDYYFVVSDDGDLLGEVSIYSLKSFLDVQMSMELFIVGDIMRDIKHKISPSKKLDEALSIMNTYDITALPVVDDKDSLKLLGVVYSQQIKSIVKKATLDRERALAAEQ